MKVKHLLGSILMAVALMCMPYCVVSVQAVEEGHSVHHETTSAHMGGEAVVHKAEATGHGAAGAEAAHGEHHALTHGQVMNFVWHCLNFTILAVVLFKLLRAPISNALTSRTEEIEKAFKDLDAKKKDAEKKYAEYEKKLSKMDKEAERILSTFIQQGEAEKEKIIQQAKESAERIKAQAELYVQQELEKAKQELQREVADIAVAMAEDIIRKNLTEQDHHKLISEYLEKVVTKN